MSNPAVQLQNQRVTIFEGEKVLHEVEAWNLKDANNQLAYANLILLQALVERQSVLADALTNLTTVLTTRIRPPDPEAAMEAAAAQVQGLLTKLGMKLPNMPAR